MTRPTEPTAPTEPTEPKRLSRAQSRLASAWFLILLAVPAVLAAFGVRPDAVENRELAEAPAFLARALRDGSYFSGLDTFVAENLPLRDVAIRARATVDYRIFGDTQNPRVVPGDNGWLYFRDEWRQACPDRTPTDVLADLAELNTRHGDGTVTLLVAPDKMRIYPEHLPFDSTLKQCVDDRAAELRTRVAGQSNLVNAWPAFEALAEESTDNPDSLLYYKHDSHWTPLGRLTAVRELIQHLDPTLWDESEVRSIGPVEREGDLTTLMGMPWVVESTGYEIERGVQIEDARTHGFWTRRATGDARVVPGRTIFVLDSQMDLALSLIQPFFEELILVGWQHIEDPAALSLLPKADRIIIERVERGLYSSFVAEDIEPLIKAE